MTEETRERPLPVRTMHDFLFELSGEWDRFRTGSLLNIVTTIVLFVLFIPRYLLVTLKRGGPFDTLIALGIVAALLYNIYLSYRQHEFYRRWEKRLGLLLHMEEELLAED